MTLIVALQGSNGIVLAADSRGTIGDPRGLTAINDDQTKLFSLAKHAGIGISGASELAAKLIDELARDESFNDDTPFDELVDGVRTFVRGKYDDWFEKYEVDKRPVISLTFVGYQIEPEKEAIPRTMLLHSGTDFAPQLFPNGNCLTGVPQYAVYLMHRLYDSRMPVDSLCKLAAYLISETATQDPKVGGPIKIATLTVEDGYQELEPAQVREIVRGNEEQNERLRKFFFGGG